MPTVTLGQVFGRLTVVSQAPPKQQARNRRSNINITWKGETKTLTEWCEILNKPYMTVRVRIVKGWSIDRAFTT